MFISIPDFDTIEETNNSSYISITVIDAMDKPEETIRFDKQTNYESGKWIQVN